MSEITIPFSSQDEKDLREFKSEVSTPSKRSSGRYLLELPEIQGADKEYLENNLKEGVRPRGKRKVEPKIPPDLYENLKASFISSGGNIAEVSKIYDMDPRTVLRLAEKNDWPIYGGSTKALESRSRTQLNALKEKLWHRIERVLDTLDIETKHKEDIVQYRTNSEYIEPLQSRSSTFKVLMDQYMRVSTLLEPELFSNDPDSSNTQAKKARETGRSIEDINRDMADFMSQVVLGVVDKARNDRDFKGYEDVIEAEVVDDGN